MTIFDVLVAVEKSNELQEILGEKKNYMVVKLQPYDGYKEVSSVNEYYELLKEQINEDFIENYKTMRVDRLGNCFLGQNGFEAEVVKGG